MLQSTSTDWVTVQDIRPTLQFTSAGVTTSSNHGSLTGLLNDDHPQYMLTSGSRSMIGSLDMGSYTITNVTTINCTDILHHSTSTILNCVNTKHIKIL